jgi:hypothetical protein
MMKEHAKPCAHYHTRVYHNFISILHVISNGTLG